MRDVLLLGAGKIGEMIVEMLATTGDYNVTVCDLSQENLDRMPVHEAVNAQVLDVSDEAALATALEANSQFFAPFLTISPLTLRRPPRRLKCTTST